MNRWLVGAAVLLVVGMLPAVNLVEIVLLAAGIAGVAGAVWALRWRVRRCSGCTI